MAKKLNQQDLLKLTSIDTPPTDSVAFAAKSDGLYQKVGTTESKLSTTDELLDFNERISEIDETTSAALNDLNSRIKYLETIINNL